MFSIVKEGGHEKTIYRRANSSGFERGRIWSIRVGVMMEIQNLKISVLASIKPVLTSLKRRHFQIFHIIVMS
jgi:hypothetical protein